MTTQQVKNLHPFVYSIKILDLLEYPDISAIDMVTFNNDNAYAVSPSFEIYGTKTSASDSTNSALMKLRKMDIHEHYFSVTEPTDSSFDPVLYQPGSYQSPISDGSVNITPITKARYYCNDLYVMAICKSDISGTDLSNNTNVILQQFVPLSKYGDLCMNWEVTNLENRTAIYDPQHYANYDRHGIFGVSGEDHIYTYMHDACISVPTIYITKILRTTGAITTSFSITGIGPSVNDIIIDKPSALENDIFLTINKSSGLWLGTVSIDVVDTSLQQLQKLSSSSIASKPATYPYIDANGIGTHVAIFSEPGSKTDTIYITEAKTSISNSIKAFNKPYTYTIDQTLRFGNEDLDFDDQVYFDFASTRNPLNKDIIYVAYFTSSGYIRIVKLYKYLPTGKTRNVYVILWATRADSVGSAFMVGSKPFVHDSVSGNAINLIADNVGDLLVFARQANGVVYVWKVREYLLDLGHSQISDVTASPLTMTNFLANMEADYSAEGEGIYIGFLPKLNDVIFSSISTGDTIDIVFKYINYDIFQSGTEDTDGKTLIDRFVTNLTAALTVLYENSSITVVNLSSTGNTLEATNATITIKLPKGSAIKPCVARGSEVVRCTGALHSLILIEKIHDGDYVLNQEGVPVQVLKHTVNTICTNKWTSPFIITKGYFGQGQPYRKLFISGDHGILFGNKRLYPYKMPGAFRQVPVNEIVEYHHLLLENHQTNFYFANGLLVESLHEGVYMA
jgi:hypothetical protein